MRGNERGQARVERARRVLDEIGIGGERLDMFFMSGSQASAFAIAAHTMTERIRKLGPNPLKLAGNGAQADADTAGEDTVEDASFRGRRT